jgi:hypothetical protein
LLDYTGKSFNELKGRGMAKIVHPDDFNKNKRYGENASKTGKDYESEIEYIKTANTYGTLLEL